VLKKYHRAYIFYLSPPLPTRILQNCKIRFSANKDIPNTDIDIIQTIRHIVYIISKSWQDTHNLFLVNFGLTQHHPSVIEANLGLLTIHRYRSALPKSKCAPITMNCQKTIFCKKKRINKPNIKNQNLVLISGGGRVGCLNKFDQWFSWPRISIRVMLCMKKWIHKWDKKNMENSDHNFEGGGSKKMLTNFFTPITYMVITVSSFLYRLS